MIKKSRLPVKGLPKKAIISMAATVVSSYKSSFLYMLTLPKKFMHVSLVYHLIMGVKNPGHSKEHDSAMYSSILSTSL